MPSVERQPFTCVECWEKDRLNVPLEAWHEEDPRSVEVKLYITCPNCGRKEMCRL